VTSCSGSIQFHVISIRSDTEFVFFTGWFLSPCLVGRSTPLGFSNPNNPLYGHLSSIDSTATSGSTIYSATKVSNFIFSYILKYMVLNKSLLLLD